VDHLSLVTKLEANFVIYLSYFFRGIESDSPCKLLVMTFFDTPFRASQRSGIWKTRRGNQRMEKPFALIMKDDSDISVLFRYVLDVADYHTEIIKCFEALLQIPDVCVYA